MEHHLLLTIRCGVFKKILACIAVVSALPQLFQPFHSHCTQVARDSSCSCTVSSFRQCCLWCCSIDLLFQDFFFGNFCMCGIAISSSSAVCCFSSSWQTVREDPLWYSGADPGFFLGRGALVSCSTSTPINHIVFFLFLQNTICIGKLQVISGGGGCTPPAPSP